jgi:hypothetical protein
MNTFESKAAFQALAGIAENNPLIRAAIKYWWLAIPGGIVMYSRLRKRPSIDLEGVLVDFGVSFGPIIPLIMLSESLARSSSPSIATAVPAASQVKEAQFQVVPPSITPAPQPFPVS